MFSCVFQCVSYVFLGVSFVFPCVPRLLIYVPLFFICFPMFSSAILMVPFVFPRQYREAEKSSPPKILEKLEKAKKTREHSAKS